MAPLPFIKFDHVVEAIAAGSHDNIFNSDTDTVKVLLSNTAPNAATDTILANIVEIPSGNGYPAGGVDAQNSRAFASGIITVSAVAAIITATGGPVGPFQYAVAYNATVPGGPLLGYWNRGATTTLQDSDSVTFTWTGNVIFTLS